MIIQPETCTDEEVSTDPFFSTVLERRTTHGSRVRPQGAVEVRFADEEPDFSRSSKKTNDPIGVAEVEQAILACIQPDANGREQAKDELRRRTLLFLRQHSADMVYDKRQIAGQLKRLYRDYRPTAVTHEFALSLDYVGSVADLMGA